MSEQKPQGASEGIVGQSALTAGLGGTELQRKEADMDWLRFWNGAPPSEFFQDAARRAFEAGRAEVVAEAAKLRGLLVACRGSVKTDLNAYERLLVAKQKHNEQQTPTYIAAEAEAQRLFELLEQIDALALTTPNAKITGADRRPG